ncbi:MAG: DUF4278 domain-containing protein [Geitlerinemataceae cyanobacterium]
MSEIDLVFAIPLAMGLGAGYVANKFNDEIADLGIIVSIVSAIIGIIIAPWQLQLFLFVLVIVYAQWLWRSNKTDSPSDVENFVKVGVVSSPQKVRSPSSEIGGKIIRKYRGISYEVPVSSESPDQEEIGGKYRGNPWKTPDRQGIIEAVLSSSDLKYRGVRWTIEEPLKSQDNFRSSGRSKRAIED